MLRSSVTMTEYEPGDYIKFEMRDDRSGEIEWDVAEGGYSRSG